MVDEVVLRTAYEQARLFYKGHAKAENKRYDPDVAPEKHRRREALLAPALGFFLQNFRDPSSPYVKNLRENGIQQAISIGDRLRQNNIRIGNCLEMCLVTASFLNEADSSVPKAIGDVPPPGDHDFLIVGDSSIEGMNIAELVGFESEGPSFILDTWAGIFCRTQD
jgi:hypothetical protein